jgi:hypothetical protein
MSSLITTGYIINDKDHVEIFNKRTIYGDLVDKLQLIESLDLIIKNKRIGWH